MIDSVSSCRRHGWRLNGALQQKAIVLMSAIGTAEAEARGAHLPEIRLLTNELWAADIAMYVRHGYRETHREPHEGTDLVYLTKSLGASDRS